MLRMHPGCKLNIFSICSHGRREEFSNDSSYESVWGHQMYIQYMAFVDMNV
jgi:hypothetical protein